MISVNNSTHYSPTFTQYAILATRLTHALSVAAPGIIIALYFNLSPAPQTLTFILSFTLLSVIVFQACGVYSDNIFTGNYRFKTTFFAWCTAFVFLFLGSAASSFLAHLPLSFYLLWFCCTLALLVLSRLLTLHIFQRLMRSGFFLSSSVIWGVTESGLELARYLKKHQDIRTGVMGFIDDRVDRLPEDSHDIKLLGDTSTLIQMIRKRQVTQVLVALPWQAVQRMDGLVAVLRQLPVSVLIVPDMQAMHYARNRVSEISGIPMFNVSDFPLKGWSPVIKRAEDLLLSTFFILLAAPLILLIAILIKLDSPGPVLFKQKRYGYGNQLIRVYKFRTMFHAMRDEHASVQTTKSDRRVTPLGRFLRRSSLDELPQLFNVLTGHMSMVGPRPHAKETKAAGVLFEDAVSNYSARHRVKPGITGWAQINGYRGETDTLAKIQKRVDLDLEYIENWSVLFDLYIIAKTPLSMLFSKEAY